MSTAIVFGVVQRDAQEDWGGRNQLLLALSRYAPVVLLEGRRSRWSQPVSTIERVSDNLFVVRNAFSLRSSRLRTRFSRRAALVDGAWFHKNLRSIGVLDYVYWLTVADPVLALGVPSEQLIYDCADPNYLPEGQAEFDLAERQIAERAALTVSTARSLHQKMLRLNPESFLLPNATSRVFHPLSTAGLPKPLSLRERRTPVIGYLGTVDARFDPAFVLHAARALPECTFAIVGRINDDQQARVAELRNLPNVVMPGQVDYRYGPEWVAAFDVGILPFAIGEMNDAVNPVKMYMYLMAGLPVVASEIAECRDNEFVRTARTPDEFARLLEEVTGRIPTADREQRIAFALDNTWEVRAGQAMTILAEHGLYPT